MEHQHYLPITKNFGTLSVHAGKSTEEDSYLCLLQPVVPSVTFKVHFSENEDHFSHEVYSSHNNPTRNSLQQCLATLEGGEHALCFSSGCGVLTSLLTVLKPGSHIICSNSIFGGTVVQLIAAANSFSFTTSFVDVYNQENLENAIQSNTAMIWLETVSNPMMKVADIRNISKIAQERNILLVVDNSFLTPYFHRPLELGADAVCHSLTKYINGHGDVVMGVIVLNKKDLYDKLKFAQYAMGVTPSSVDCGQVLRSLKSFPLRMRQHCINAFKVAQYLESHQKVAKVMHPGLPSHPQHELFKSQTSGHSGILSFYIDGDLSQTKKLLNSFKLITPSTSFGTLESIAEISIIMSQKDVPKEIREPGITDNLIRLSVGLEDADDVIADLKQALDRL